MQGAPVACKSLCRRGRKGQKKFTRAITGRLRIHDLRHTLGRRLRKDLGVPLETIMGILRHADIRETLIYAPYSIDEGRAAMDKLDGMVVSVHPSGQSSVAVPVLADPENR